MTLQNSYKTESSLLLAQRSSVAPSTEGMRSKSLCRMLGALCDLTLSLKICLRRERPAGALDTLLTSHPFDKTGGAKGSGFLYEPFLKINSYLIEADRHLVKMTVSGKATAPLLPAPNTHPLFVEELLWVLTKERDPLWNFLCSIWGMKLTENRLRRLDWQRSDGGWGQQAAEEAGEVLGKFPYAGSWWKNWKPTALFWTVLVPYRSDMSQVAHKNFTTFCPPVDTVTYRDPIRNLFWQCFQRGLEQPRASAALTVFSLIWNDGFWWDWKAGATGSRELCHRAMTSVKLTAAPSNSVWMSWSDYKCVLWAARNDAERVLFQSWTHGREASTGGNMKCFSCWKIFYPVLLF